MTVENSKYHSRSKLLEQIEQVWNLREILLKELNLYKETES